MALGIKYPRLIINPSTSLERHNIIIQKRPIKEQYLVGNLNFSCFIHIRRI